MSMRYAPVSTPFVLSEILELSGTFAGTLDEGDDVEDDSPNENELRVGATHKNAEIPGELLTNDEDRVDDVAPSPDRFEIDPDENEDDEEAADADGKEGLDENADEDDEDEKEEEDSDGNEQDELEYDDE